MKINGPLTILLPVGTGSHLYIIKKHYCMNGSESSDCHGKHPVNGMWTLVKERIL